MVVIIGGGGHGVAIAYYLLNIHAGITQCCHFRKKSEYLGGREILRVITAVIVLII